MPQIKNVSITKTIAEDADLLILQNPTTGETYKITKADFLAGLTAQPSTPQIPTYINLPLTETTGNIASDTSGNNRNGIYVNASLTANGAILNGNSRISLANSHPALNPLSVGLQFKTNSNSNQGLWEFRASQDLSSGTYTPALMMNQNGQIAVYGFPSGTGYTTQTYNDNVMHTSIIVMSANVVKVFVDKVKILEANANPITGFEGFFSIGATRANGSFTGQVKNFKVWNLALNDNEATQYS
jgi:hypothetical protein